MRIDNIGVFGDGSGTGNVPTASFATTASFAQTASFVAGGTSEWTSQAITITGTNSNPAKGVRADDFIRYRLIGPKQYEIDMLYTQTSLTGASAGSGLYLFTLPAGLSFNTTVQPVFTNTSFIFMGGSPNSTRAYLRGSFGMFIQGTKWGTIGAQAYDSTRFTLGTISNMGGSLNLDIILGADVFPLNVNNYHFSMKFSFLAA